MHFLNPARLMKGSASLSQAAGRRTQALKPAGLPQQPRLYSLSSRGFSSVQHHKGKNARGSKHIARAAAAGISPSSKAPPREQVFTQDPANNVTEYVYERMGATLHQQENHPIAIIKQAIYDYFEKQYPGVFKQYDDLNPVVSVAANFDEVLVPQDHVSRSPNDTYYVTKDSVLRCHTSAHQAEMLRQGQDAFFVTGDVYRRDSIDATHFPVFHQMEGVRVIGPDAWKDSGMDPTEYVARDLKQALEGCARYLFGDVEVRWADTYFPFTDPSYELEIFFNGKWLEVLGCGVMQQKILDENFKDAQGQKAWAFGLGLERLAMVLFDVPDIRLFWSNDERFLRQFKKGDLTTKFQPFSRYPPCYKDMAFWISPEFSENNLCELVRNIGGDIVEEVQLIDEFHHPKKQRTSNCFRIMYRSMERSLTDEEINAVQERVRKETAEKLKVELR